MRQGLIRDALELVRRGLAIWCSISIRPEWERAICASACRSRLRRSSRNLTICMASGSMSWTGRGDDPHGSFRDEAEAKIEERRRAMEVAALIVDTPFASAAKARREGPGARGAGHSRRSARGGRVYPHARSAARAACTTASRRG